MNSFDLNENYKNLMLAVVKLAIDDYKLGVLYGFSDSNTKNESECVLNYISAKHFLLSEDLGLYTPLSGKMIINEIEKNCRKAN